MVSIFSKEIEQEMDRKNAAEAKIKMTNFFTFLLQIRALLSFWHIESLLFSQLDVYFLSLGFPLLTSWQKTRHEIVSATEPLLPVSAIQ